MESKMTVNEFGAKEWKNEKGLVHREDGPALIYKSGSRVWYINGEQHREDGPAAIYSDGTKEWWLKGKRHHENGPAFIYSNGTKEYWLNDKRYTEKEYKEEVRKLKLSKLKL